MAVLQAMTAIASAGSTSHRSCAVDRTRLVTVRSCVPATSTSTSLSSARLGMGDSRITHSLRVLCQASLNACVVYNKQSAESL